MDSSFWFNTINLGWSIVSGLEKSSNHCQPEMSSKDKEALFNLAYNETDNISSQAIL